MYDYSSIIRNLYIYNNIIAFDNCYEPQHYENYRFLTWFKNNISRTNEEITNLNILWNTAKIL
jgi:hypothetical protein